jgi:hypothetical protein
MDWPNIVDMIVMIAALLVLAWWVAWLRCQRWQTALAFLG